MKLFPVPLFAVLVLFVGVPSAWAGPVLFVVGERVKEHGDSFVLPLEDPADIAHARDLIARGPEAAGAPLVFAEIVPGADGINRDVFAEGQPLWNWHVSKFEGFADGGIELVDGWPTFIEQDVAGWMANTRRDKDDPNAPGHIGFWSYTVVAEIAADGGSGGSPPAVPLPAAAYVGGLMLSAIAGRQLLAGRRRRGR
jgi:hypothetical protein